MGWTRAKSMFAEVRRRRVLRALGLYVVGAWLLMQVADATFEPLGVPLWVQKALILALVAGLVPAAILAWVFDLTRHGVERTAALPGPDGPARALDGAAGGGTKIDAPADAVPMADDAPAAMSPIAAIAVLPFADLSPGGDHGWFCDGLAAEIIDSLCCVRGLRIASRTAASRFRDGATDPREVGRLLGVDAILEGSLRVAAGRMRISAQLIDTREGWQAWSEAYERPVADVFAVQQDIAESVARALKLQMSAPPPGRADRHAPRSLDAYEAYVRGRQAIRQFQRGKALEAPDHFRRAIALEPDYARAHAGLADALALVATWRFAPPATVLGEGVAAANRALDLAPDLAEAHVAQGQMRALAGDRAGARRSFERAIELDPKSFEAWHFYARDAYAHGEHARAAGLFEAAYRTRPDDYTPLLFAATCRQKTGDDAGAHALYVRAADGLVRQADLEPDNPRIAYAAAGALIRLGRADAARAMADRAIAISPDDWGTLYNVACYLVVAGEHDRALDLLERAMRDGGGYPDWLANDPDLDALRGHPRFEALLAAMGPAPGGAAA